MTFTPDTDISYGNKIQWTVQPVESGMLGVPSNGSVYWIPSVVSEELNDRRYFSNTRWEHG